MVNIYHTQKIMVKTVQTMTPGSNLTNNYTEVGATQVQAAKRLYTTVCQSY